MFKKLSLAVFVSSLVGCQQADTQSAEAVTAEAKKTSHVEVVAPDTEAAREAAAQGHGHAEAYSKDDPRSFITDEKVLANIEEWQDLKFGFVSHWGIYSLGDVAESWMLDEHRPRGGDYGRSGTQMWKDSNENIDEFRTNYWNLAKKFNPVKFDPKEWVELAKEAGTKYFVFTTKHHDGFNMYDTQYSDYKITGEISPFKNNPNADVTKALFTEFQKNDFMVGAYYSKPDWHNENYWDKSRPLINRSNNYDATKEPERWQKYVDFTHGQIRELLSDYGDVDILWLDGGWVSKKNNQDLQMDNLAAMARELQPGIMVVDRTIHGPNENYLTPEQQMPNEYIDAPWETIMTATNKWGHRSNLKYKTSQELVGNLVHVVAMGGNFLLNLGATPEGTFTPEAKQLFKEIGQWVDVNGEAIFETRPIAPYKEGNLRYTASKDKQRINAIFMKDIDIQPMPESVSITVEGAEQVCKAELLGTDITPSFTVSEGKVQVAFTEEQIDAMADSVLDSQAWTYSLHKQCS